MNEIYNEIAINFEKLANCYRELSAWDTKNDKNISENTIEINNEEKSISIETLRAVLLSKSKIGKTNELKVLLSKFCANKLSEIKKEDYESLMLECEKL